MTTQMTSPLADPTAAGPSRRRRPGRTALIISAAAVATSLVVILMALGALTVLGLAVFDRPGPASSAAEAAQAPATAQAPPVATHDEAGAIAFSQYWATTVAEAFRTGDPEPVRDTSTAECPACQAVVAVISDPSRDTRRPSQTTLEVIDAAVVSTTADTTVVHAILRVDHSSVDLGGGAVDVSGLEFEDEITLRWSGDHWLVDAVDGDAWTPVLV